MGRLLSPPRPCPLQARSEARPSANTRCGLSAITPGLRDAKWDLHPAHLNQRPVRVCIARVVLAKLAHIPRGSHWSATGCTAACALDRYQSSGRKNWLFVGHPRAGRNFACLKLARRLLHRKPRRADRVSDRRPAANRRSDTDTDLRCPGPRSMDAACIQCGDLRIALSPLRPREQGRGRRDGYVAAGNSPVGSAHLCVRNSEHAMVEPRRRDCARCSHGPHMCRYAAPLSERRLCTVTQIAHWLRLIPIARRHCVFVVLATTGD